MITLFIGHRGTGKTSFGKKLAAAVTDQYGNARARHWDLDSLIETESSQSIGELLMHRGEEQFRQLEEASLHRLLEKLQQMPEKIHFVSVGAGYQGSLPAASAEIEVVWLGRDSDAWGRIFLDRPRLRPKLSPMEESRELFHQRHWQYPSRSHRVWWRAEGFAEIQTGDKIFFGLESHAVGGVLTLTKQMLPLSVGGPSAEAFAKLLTPYLRLGPRSIEVRDDFWSADQLLALVAAFDKNKLILSFRKTGHSDFEMLNLDEYVWDWPLELDGQNQSRGSAKRAPSIVSLHTRKERLTDTIASLTKGAEALNPQAHLKLAIEIHSWEELAAGHRWWQADPDQRSFLPRSSDGRWLWYRMLTSPQMRLGFWRLYPDGVLDQPTLSQWCQSLGWRPLEGFAAVLGDPIAHSLSPGFHHEFFKKQKMLFLGVRVLKNEFSQALDVLDSLGLKAAAVTSPLKTTAHQWVNSLTNEAKISNSVNTLYKLPTSDPRTLKAPSWIGHNTDLAALRDWLSSYDLSQSLVWGRGALADTLLLVAPDLKIVSARNTPGPMHSVDNLIWAVPRNQFVNWPNIKAKKVLDMNYTMDSPGREFAQMTGCEYENGQDFFAAQALAQQKYWGGQ